MFYSQQVMRTHNESLPKPMNMNREKATNERVRPRIKATSSSSSSIQFAYNRLNTCTVAIDAI